jgi:hypothetical protein
MGKNSTLYSLISESSLGAARSKCSQDTLPGWDVAAVLFGPV